MLFTYIKDSYNHFDFLLGINIFCFYIVLECEIVDIANSLDIHGSCVNFKSKINSICVKEIFG